MGGNWGCAHLLGSLLGSRGASATPASWSMKESMPLLSPHTHMPNKEGGLVISFGLQKGAEFTCAHLSDVALDPIMCPVVIMVCYRLVTEV